MPEMREAGPYVRRFRQLMREYDRKQRHEAVENLIAAREALAEMVLNGRLPRSVSPSPFPKLIIPDVFWVKAGNYWFSYRVDDDGPIMTGAYHHQADIPALVRATKNE